MTPADDATTALLAWRDIDRVHGTHDDEGMDALLRLRTVADRIAEDRDNPPAIVAGLAALDAASAAHLRDVVNGNAVAGRVSMRDALADLAASLPTGGAR